MNADYAWPVGLVPNDGGCSWEYAPNEMKSTSRFTGKTKVVSGQGDKWLASMTFNDMIMVDAMKLNLLVMRLQNNGTVSVPVFGRGYSGDVQLAGRVVGAGQIGLSVYTDGWPVSSTVLTAGQLIGINGELKTVTSDVVSNSSGFATIEFYPALRESPADNKLITHAPAYVTMEAVTGSNVTQSSIAGIESEGNNITFALSLQEAI